MQSLQEILLYGVKGMAAYANHARRLGKSDETVSAFIEEALFATMTNVNFDMQSLFELVLECGHKNLRVMEMLDAGHTEKAAQQLQRGHNGCGRRPMECSHHWLYHGQQRQ